MTSIKKLSGLFTLLFLCFLNPCYPQLFNNIYQLKSGVSDGKCNFKGVEIQPGKEYELAKFEGAGIITYFYSVVCNP